MRRFAFFAVLVCLCAAVLPTLPTGANSTSGSSSTLVKNIITETRTSDPSNGSHFSLTVAGTKAFFSEYKEGNGYELWVSDGTSAGTGLLYDLNPGYEDSQPGQLIDQMVELNGKLLVVAASAQGKLLWRSDGTPAGTQLITDSESGKAVLMDSYELFPVGNAAYFRGFDNKLWKSDGTQAGTTFLHRWDSLYKLGSFGALHNAVLFFVQLNDSGNYTNELWVTNGTPAGTQRIKTLGSYESSFPSRAVVFNNQLYFINENGLWRSDGTESGTQVILTHSSFAGEYILHAGMLYYRGRFTVGSETHIGLMRLDLTSSTPELVYDFSVPSFYSDSFPNSFLSVGSQLFFSGPDNEIWTTNGSTTKAVATSSGARLYRPTQSGWLPLNQPGAYAVSAGSLFLGATRSPAPSPLAFDLWGITISTGKASLVHQTTTTEDYGVRRVGALGNTLIFSTGGKLWKSDGSQDGTALVYSRPMVEKGLYDIQSVYVPEERAVLGNKLIFAVANNMMRELWVSDGTEMATTKIFEEQGGGGSINLISWNGAAYFWALKGDNRGLWRTDGTQTGTVSVKKFDTSTNMYSLVTTPSTLYFIAGVEGTMQLWKSDGTATGTVAAVNLPSELNYDDGNKLPGGITVAGQQLFFTVSQTATGRELWVSDGTQAGTHMTKDITNSTNSSHIKGLTVVGERVFFLEGVFASLGHNLWVSDGSEQGTILVKQFGPVPSGLQYPVSGQTIEFNTKAFFSGWDDSTWIEPWISDGTEAGTQRIKDINQQPSIYQTGLTQASLPYDMVIMNGKVLFTANDGLHGRELWISDGTEAGTQLLLDLNPGSIGSAPQALVSFGSFAVFAASHGPDGVEVWRTDGTAAGTTQLADVAPGPGSSNPFNFTLIGEKLFFIADDGSTGPELHMLNVNAPPITITPTSVTPTSVTPTSVTPTSVTPTSVTPTSVTATPVISRYAVYLSGIVR